MGDGPLTRPQDPGVTKRLDDRYKDIGESLDFPIKIGEEDYDPIDVKIALLRPENEDGTVTINGKKIPKFI